MRIERERAFLFWGWFGGGPVSRVYIPLRHKVQKNMAKFFTAKEANDGTDISGAITSTLAPAKSGHMMYQHLYDANPYNSLTYNRTGFQSLLSALGFRTDYDRWLEEQQVNKQEYDAQVASIEQQNTYNSPANQSELMRNAGQNPDLLGTQGVSDSASPVQDVNGMSPGESSNTGISVAMPVISSFVSHVMDSVSKGFIFAKDIVSMRQAFDRQDVDLLEKINGLADSYLRNKVSAADMTDDLSFEGRKNFLSIPRGQRSTVSKEYGIPRRYRRFFDRAVDDRANSLALENDLWKQVIERNKSKSEYARQSVSQSESGELKVMQSFWRPIVENIDEIKKLTAEFDKRMQNLREGMYDVQAAKQDFEFMYYDTLNDADAGKAKAGQDSQAYWVNFYKSSVQKVLNQTSHKITKNLQHEADKGSVFAQSCLFAWSLGDMLNFGLDDIFNLAGKLFPKNPLKR